MALPKSDAYTIGIKDAASLLFMLSLLSTEDLQLHKFDVLPAQRRGSLVYPLPF
jgi:hypothetical protein